MDYTFYYNQGYEDGYSWLTKGWNFIHPNGSYTYPSGYTIRGYVPGGPSVWNPDLRDNYGRKGAYDHKARVEWITGWVNGINAYVKDKGLDFPEVANPYSR